MLSFLILVLATTWIVRGAEHCWTRGRGGRIKTLDKPLLSLLLDTNRIHTYVLLCPLYIIESEREDNVLKTSKYTRNVTQSNA